MSKYAIKIHCGGYRESFIMMDTSKMVHEEGGDISRTPKLFATKAAAKKGGNNSTCVLMMGWPFEIVTADEAQKHIKAYDDRLADDLRRDRQELRNNYLSYAG
jgi:hypothetical protein